MRKRVLVGRSGPKFVENNPILGATQVVTDEGDSSPIYWPNGGHMYGVQPEVRKQFRMTALERAFFLADAANRRAESRRFQDWITHTETSVTLIGSHVYARIAIVPPVQAKWHEPLAELVRGYIDTYLAELPEAPGAFERFHQRKQVGASPTTWTYIYPVKRTALK